MSMRFLLISIALSCLAVRQIDAARILGVFTSPSKSHLLIHAAIADTLAEAGHDVTIIGIFPNVYKKAKYNYVHIDVEKMDPSFTQNSVDKPLPFYKVFGALMTMVTQNANATMQDPKMKEFLQTHKAGDFDAIIIGYFMNDFLFGLGHHFQCPIILSFMIQPIFAVNNILGNPSEHAYVPSLFSNLKQPMGFKEKIQNYLGTFFEQNIMQVFMNRKMNEIYRQNFPADRYPPIEEVYKNVSLVLTNHHFSQGPIRPNVPSLIEIGGIQIKEKPDPLPQDIADIMDSSEKGVIYFSLGTNVQGSNLSKEKARMIFNVLSKLPYKVLLKWGDSDFPGQSENMIYKSWLPQDDILAHPKLKLFITHGGQGSVVESQYHGVPMVGIPFFGDQHSNMANVVKSGYGLSLDYSSFTEEAFRAAVVEVLENSMYIKNIQTFSQLYRDRPMTPRQLVRYWVDYVIRHKGAKHMQSPAVHMSWWQLNSLDVIAFLLAVLFTVIGILVALCKCLCCRSKAKKVKVSKNKKHK